MLMSSNDIVSAHPKSYAEIIGKSININAPQVYYGQSSSVSARLNWAIRENKKIGRPFFPVGAAFLRDPKDNDGGFLDPKKCAEATQEFIRLVSLLHHSSPSDYPGYGFWNWEEAPEEVWQVLYESDVFIQPTDEPGVASLTIGKGPEFQVISAAGTEAAPSAFAGGWTLAIERVRVEHRRGEGFARTIGSYSVLHDGIEVPNLSGATVESGPRRQRHDGNRTPMHRGWQLSGASTLDGKIYKYEVHEQWRSSASCDRGGANGCARWNTCASSRWIR